LAPPSFLSTANTGSLPPAVSNTEHPPRRWPKHPNQGPDWTRQPVAQLRYDPDDHHWRLYCADRNSRWHYYDMAEPTTNLDELITEIDNDPTGIFWG
jgi:hypothetical protein